MTAAIVADEGRMQALGAAFQRAGGEGGWIYLTGELGAGKTTFVRGFIQGAGHPGPVKSPTFTLVESYHIGGRDLHHFDLFRLAQPDELEFMGIRDYFVPGSVCLVEWPERGAGVLPPGDIRLAVAYRPGGRRVEWEAGTARGRRILAALALPPDLAP